MDQHIKAVFIACERTALNTHRAIQTFSAPDPWKLVSNETGTTKYIILFPGEFIETVKDWLKIEGRDMME